MKSQHKNPKPLKFFKRSEDDTIFQHTLTQILNSTVDSSELSSNSHGGDSVSEKTMDGWVWNGNQLACETLCSLFRV